MAAWQTRMGYHAREAAAALGMSASGYRNALRGHRRFARPTVRLAIAIELLHGPSAIDAAMALGEVRHGPYSPDEDALIRARYPAEGSMVARALGRTAESVHRRAQRLGVRGPRRGPRRQRGLIARDRAIMAARAGGESLSSIARRVGLSHQRVHQIIRGRAAALPTQEEY